MLGKLAALIAAPSALAQSADLPKHYFKGYFEKGFRGKTVEMFFDGQTWMHQGEQDWGGMIQSFEIGEHTKVQLCYQNDCNYTAYRYATEIYGPLKSADMHDTAAYAYGIRVTAWETTDPYIMLFSDGNCQAGFAGIFGVGDWFGDKMARNHVAMDDMSSFLTRDRVEMTFYEHDYYEGKPTVVNGPIEQCNEMKKFKDKKLESMKIKELPKTQSKGFWQVAAQSNAQIEASLTTTVSTSTGSSLTVDQQQDILSDLSKNLSYLGSPITSTYSTKTKDQVTRVFTQTTSKTCAATCEGREGQQVVLYQWAVETDNVQGIDSKTTTSTCFYQCRYNEYTQSQPACPAGACKDENCTECFPWQKVGEIKPDPKHFLFQARNKRPEEKFLE